MRQLAEELPTYEANLRAKIKLVGGMPLASGVLERASGTLRDLQDELARAEKPSQATALQPNDSKPLPVEIHKPEPRGLEAIANLVRPLLSPLATSALVILFLLFILLQREDIRDRFLRLAGTADLQRSTAALDDAASRLGRTHVIGPVCRPWISLQAPGSCEGVAPTSAIRRGRYKSWPRRGGVTVLRDILILGLAVAVQTLPAQVPAVEVPQEPFKLTTTAELVLLDVSVESQKGAHISGLTKNDFRVYEDGKLQTVSHFANEDVPVTAGLVIDMSGSMRAKRAEVATSALALIGASNPSDEIFVVHLPMASTWGFPTVFRSPATFPCCAPPCGEALLKAAQPSTMRSS